MIAIPGMKALLLDADTMGFLSAVMTQSEATAQGVYHFERIDQPKDDAETKQNMHHFKAIVWVRPTQKNIQRLHGQLLNPRFREYYVFFSNLLGDRLLEELADADPHDLVRQVNEFYADYYAVDGIVYHIGHRETRSLYQPPGMWLIKEKELMQRNIDAVLAVLLSLKIQPVIRYHRSSELTSSLAQELNRVMGKEHDLFQFKQKGDEHVLLLLDRRDDPVTPLLQQWTYQAMVHEMLTIENGRVDLSAVPDIAADLRDVVMSAEVDPFFRDNMYKTFPEVAASIKELVEEYSKKRNKNQKIESIEDMKQFFESYPEFRQLQTTMSKHMAVLSELSKQLDKRGLFAISELEQDLACTQDHSGALERLLTMMNDPKVSFDDKLRLVALYALRYENSQHQVPQFLGLLRDSADRAADGDAKRALLAKIPFIEELLKVAGQAVRQHDLFGNKSTVAKLMGLKKALVKGADCPFTQHKPWMITLLEEMTKGNLKPPNFPILGPGDANPARKQYKTIVIYMLGGFTYEESAQLRAFESQNPGTRFVLGGSGVHNSQSFIADILSAGHEG